MKTLIGFPDDDDETPKEKETENKMPKVNFGIANAEDVAASQGFEVYKGELPPNGAYEGVLKVVKIGKIGSGNDKGKSNLMLVVILKDEDYPEFDGCPCFGNLNLTDQGVPYVNQFLESLTDGSDKAKADIKRAFWKVGPVVDDAKEHILKIGRTQVNSPKGEITVLIGTKVSTYNGNTSVKIQQWMLTDGEGNGPAPEAEVVEADEEDVEDAEDEEEDGEEDPYAE